MRKKTEIRYSKSGRKYWYNPNQYQIERERIRQRKLEDSGKVRGEYDGQRSSIYCHSPKNESYMKYYEKKVEIRNQYPKWVKMDRDDWREYFDKVLHLIEYDEDYQQYKLETKTYIEIALDVKWENIKQKEKEYDGRNDEYEF